MFEDALKVSPQFVAKPIGAYRLDERYIKGVNIKLSTPNKISNDLENLLYRFKSNRMNLEDIAEFHILFERVHPFADINDKDDLCEFLEESIGNSLKLIAL